jgi:hypothetical protein
MATQWYCKIMGVEEGPMSARQLQAIARCGRLAIDDLVRKHSAGVWVRAENVIGLFDRPTLPVVVTESIAVITDFAPGASAQATQDMSPECGQFCSIELQTTDCRSSISWTVASGPPEEREGSVGDRTSRVVVPRRTLKVATGAKASALAEKLANQTTQAACFNSAADTVSCAEGAQPTDKPAQSAGVGDRSATIGMPATRTDEPLVACLAEHGG